MTDERSRPRPAADRSGGGDPVRPRNVRDGMPGEGDPPEIETGRRIVEFDGAEWTVRSEGRARVRSGGAPTPLIQLVFSSADGTEREGLAVGRTLEGLSESRLAEAFRHARPYEPDRDPAPFFEGTRRDRRDRG